MEQPFIEFYRTTENNAVVGKTAPLAACWQGCVPDNNDFYQFSISSEGGLTVMTVNISGTQRQYDEMWWTCGAIFASNTDKKSFKLIVATAPNGVTISSNSDCDLANTQCIVDCLTTSCTYPPPSTFSWFYTTNNGGTEYTMFGNFNSITTQTTGSCTSPEFIYKSTIILPKYTTFPDNTPQTIKLFCRLRFVTLMDQLKSNLTGNIHLAVRVSDVTIIQPAYTDVLNIVENQFTELKCRTSGSRPKVTVYWYKENAQAKQNIYNGITNETNSVGNGLYETISTLVFQVTKLDQGWDLTCSASNFGDNEIHARNPKTLNVLYSATVTSFTAGLFGDSQSPVYVIVDEYANVSGTCKVDGNPSATIEVSQGGTNFARVADTLEVTFSILNVTCYNNGKLICSAKNNIPDTTTEAEKSLQLNVKCSPRLEQEANHVVVAREGTMAVLSLTVIAYPPPDYQWHRYNKDHWEIIENDTNFAMTSKDLQYILTVTNVTRNHYGEYNLTLSNEHGPPLTFLFNVQNKGRPEVPVDISVSVKSSTAITVMWTPGYDGEVEQIFHIEYKPISVNYWLEVEVTDTRKDERLSTDISGLQPSTKYALRMFALNEEGNSPLSETLSFRTGDPESTSSAGTVGGAIGGVIAVGIAIVGVVCVLRRKGIPGGMKRGVLRARSTDKETRIQYIQDTPVQEETAYTQLETFSNDRDRYQPLDFAQQKNGEQGQSQHEDQCYENPLPIYDDDQSGNQERQTQTKTVGEMEPKSDMYYVNLELS